MKISKIETVPYHPKLTQFFGREVKMGLGELTDLDYGLVQVYTDKGVTGLGEIATVFPPTGTSFCNLVDEVIAPRIIGEDVTQGFTTIKVKVGQWADKDEEAVRAIRDAVGESVTIRVDANMAWHRRKEALDTLQRLEAYGIEFAEEPLAADDLGGMASVRECIDTPILVGESVWSPHTAMCVFEHKAADAVSVYVSESGGLFRAAQIFALWEAARIPCVIGIMPETGVGTAAALHLGIGMSNLGYASDCCGSIYFDEELLRTPLLVEGGLAYPPHGPGLGVEVDETTSDSWRSKC